MPTQLEKLQALQKALDDATDNGTFDYLTACSAHPDTINRFCDAVQDAVNDYNADLNPEPKHPFTVIYSEPGYVNWLFFECNATDSDRAEAQLMDAYPTATVLWVNTGHGPNSRTQESAEPPNAKPGYRFYSVSTPGFFLEYELPNDNDKATDDERKLMERLEQEACNYSVYVHSSSYRLG